jgi:phosphate transport system substrate-binding protein
MQNAQKLKSTLAVILAATPLLLRAEPVKVDPALPSYQPKSGVSGELNSVGSDTLNNLMTLWAEGFSKVYPNVNIQIEGKGSSTAPPALIEGTAQLGPMSRTMKKEEEESFEAKFGYKPTGIGVALDALAVYVHKDNPLDGASLEQIDAVFSKTRKLGYKDDITVWGKLGLTGDLAKQPISLYGRNSASGTYGYFKEHTLGKGDFKDSVKEQPGSATVVNGVTNDKLGMGYSGLGYKTSGVKALKLSFQGGEMAEGTYENVLAGKYPLSRMLFVYVGRKPGSTTSPVVEEFFKYALSKEGQEVVVKDGYLPLPAALAAKQLELLTK